MRRGGGARAASIAALAAIAIDAQSHSASDAYLTLESVTPASATRTSDRPATLVVHGQWDIALRDLDFVVRLDDDGDGDITWRELRGHQAAIARYALARLAVRGDGKPCRVVLTRQLVDSHADGSYAALFFDAACPASTTRVAVDYRLFFDIDPSHRAIVLSRVGRGTSTAVLSPEHASIELQLDAVAGRP